MTFKQIFSHEKEHLTKKEMLLEIGYDDFSADQISRKLKKNRSGMPGSRRTTRGARSMQRKRSKKHLRDNIPLFLCPFLRLVLRRF